MTLGFSDVRSRLLGGGFLGWKRNGEEDEGPPRRAKPIATSIRWNPVALSGRELDEDHARGHELFVAQTALRQARGHLSGSGEEFGFLVGRHYRCRDTDAPWIHISEALPASTPFPAGGETDRFRLACVSASSQAASRGLEVVGWYHEHRYLGPTFTDGDRQLHEDSFPEPWHCALVFVTGGARTAGAFIQPWKGERYYQRALVSFQEVLDDVAGVDSDVRSCIDWSNYVAERPVSVLAPENRVSSQPAPEAAPPSPASEPPSPASEPPSPASEPLSPASEPPPAETRPSRSTERRPEAAAGPPWLRQFEERRRADAAARSERPRRPEATRSTEPVPDAVSISRPGPKAPESEGVAPKAPEAQGVAPEAPEMDGAAPIERAAPSRPGPGSVRGAPPAAEATQEAGEMDAQKPAPALHALPIDPEFGLLLPREEERSRRGRAWRAALRWILPGE